MLQSESLWIICRGPDGGLQAITGGHVHESLVPIRRLQVVCIVSVGHELL